MVAKAGRAGQNETHLDNGVAALGGERLGPLAVFLGGFAAGGDKRLLAGLHPSMMLASGQT
jgi:hypothetical protein